MNWLDIVLLCLAGVGFMKGLFDGMIKQVISLIGIIVAILFCAKAAEWLAVYIAMPGWLSPEWVTITGYILGFVLILAVFVLIGEVIHRIIGATPLGFFNHVGGGFLGLIIMILFVSLGLNLLETFDKKSSLISPETKVESRFYFQTKAIIPTIFPHKLFHNE